MRKAEAVRFGAVSVAGMAVCCTLTALVAAGSMSVAVGWIGGSVGLAVVSGLLVCALIVVRKRNTAPECGEAEPSDTTMDRAAS